MTTLFSVLVLLHVLFMAALVGGYLVAAVQGGTINPIMVWGARIQLVTGLLMMSLGGAAGYQLDHMMLGIKLVIALAVVALAEIAHGKQNNGEPKPGLVHGSGALALVNAAIGLLALSPHAL